MQQYVFLLTDLNTLSSSTVPGPPSRVYFPDVTHSTAKVVWAPPEEKNGIITGYKVAYREKAVPPSQAIVDSRLDSSKRDYSVLNLQKQRYYVFSLTARTKLGWGATVDVEVRTEVNRSEWPIISIV